MSGCAFEGCDRPAETRGYCGGHYSQFNRGVEMKPLQKNATKAQVKAATPHIIRLRREGMKIKDIAAEVDINKSTITSILAQNGGVGERIQDRAPHGAPARWQEGCRCKKCLEGRREYKRVEHQKHLAKLSEEQLVTEAEKSRLATAQRQQRSTTTARRNGRSWTGTEVELAIRDDLTIEEIGRRLGRSYASISNVRAALADPHHPAHARYAGLLGKSPY